MGTDLVGISDLQVDKVPIILANNFSEAESFLDGILGLGFDSKTKTFLDLLLDGKKLTSPIFSVYIDETNVNGGVTFGGIDTARYGGFISWNPIVPDISGTKSSWRIQLSSIKLESVPVNGSDLNSAQLTSFDIPFPKDMTALVDTGSSLALFPVEVANQINTKLGLKPIESNPKTYGIPCNNTIPTHFGTVTIKLGQTTLSFTPSEYLYLAPVDSIVYCNSGFTGLGNNQTVILGNVLLRKYYQIYDRAHLKVGFAKANRGVSVNNSFVNGDSTKSPNGTWLDSNEKFMTNTDASSDDFNIFSMPLVTFMLMIPLIFFG
ncbi:aspartic peptidase domain-containing protein [Globomyces pollinis-pini]|nr:aspartic peptidase domain-containing protein [Globomyces pollinis-pini]